MKPKPHIPELDGIRGLAMIAVLFAHFVRMEPAVRLDRAVLSVTESFWPALDSFFVLSGFLITGILLDSKGSPGYYRNYFARRTLRVFPLYYGFLILAFFVAPLFLRVPELETLKSNQWWFWTYTTNFLIAAEGWKAAPWATHIWSLAVEEQFYILWPVLVYFLNRRKLVIACLSFALLAIVCRIALRQAGQPTANYVLMFCRMDSLAMGSLVAVMFREAKGREILERYWRPVMYATGTILLALFVWKRGFQPGSLVMQTAGYTLFAFFFASLIYRGASSENRFWRSRVLTFFGHYSYAIYIFHVPVLKIVEWYMPIDAFPTLYGSKLPGQAVYFVACLIPAVGIALLSWHMYEKHFLKLKRYFSYEEKVKKTSPAMEKIAAQPINS